MTWRSNRPDLTPGVILHLRRRLGVDIGLTAGVPFLMVAATLASVGTGEVIMSWFFIILAVLAVGLVVFVWFQQRRHSVPPGKPDDPEARAQRQGKTWGSSPGIF